MIIVDIYVPALNSTYNFKLEEDACVGTVIDEISEMISQKEQYELVGNRNELMLCSLDMNLVLEQQSKLSLYGLQTGAQLMLL